MLREIKVLLVGVFCLLGLLVSGTASAGSVVILDSTVTGGISSKEAVYAQSLGHTVTILSPAQWQAMSQAQF